MLFPLVAQNLLAGGQLVDYGISFGSESEKKLSSLARKVGSLATMMSAGTAGSDGGWTSTGLIIGAGVAQPESTSVDSSNIGQTLRMGIG